MIKICIAFNSAPHAYQPEILVDIIINKVRYNYSCLGFEFKYVDNISKDQIIKNIVSFDPECNFLSFSVDKHIFKLQSITHENN